MALTDYAAYKSAMPHAVVSLNKANRGTLAFRMWSRWTDAPIGGAIPGAAAALNSATLGALNRNSLLSGMATWLKSITYGRAGASSVFLYDRLAHQGGLSGTVTGVVTTNLPTAALTRYTSGVGVMPFFETYGLLGTTATTLTVSYTNSAGTAGRTSPALTVGGTSDRGIGVFIPIPLQIGDIGVRSIESVTLAASTGTAGSWGVTLLKPLHSIAVWDEAHQFKYDNIRDLGGMFESIQADCCLAHAVGTNTVDTFTNSGYIELLKQV